MFQEGVKAFNCLGHGTSFGRQHDSEGYLQSKDLQKDLFSIFCLPIGMRRKWRLPDRKAILLRVQSADPRNFVIPTLRETKGRNLGFAGSSPPRSRSVPDVENIWKSCGKR
jgi:hypothetical protein